PSFVLYLAEKETHELSLLYIHYLLKKQGVEVINLGLSVPLIDVVDSCNINNPDYIFTMIND
ncbi:MAG TPA: helix-turn-helix-type transcriptional regulator, partial [Saprospirales bacterium]|nr:helix-turn-helix-type transcriptional regulator [Saprospirales bacterium]